MLTIDATPTNLATPAAAQPAPAAPWKVENLHKGEARHELSSQWFKRPADQRFTSLDDLMARVRGEADASRSTIVDCRDIRVSAVRDDPETMTLILPTGRDESEVVAPNHWSFGQLAGLIGAPAGYLRRLPAALAAINMQYGLASYREEAVKAYFRRDDSAPELRAATGPEYGRIYDHEIVSAVQRIAGNGTGDTQWKVPGTLDWTTGFYDPAAPITKDSTTLFASDRDVWLFLVDDTHPIEIGKTPDGRPDLLFRGFYAWNSEVGSATAGLATFYLRAICCNRIMWGVEGFQSMNIRHSKNAPVRFSGEAIPALNAYSNQSTGALLAGINDARNAIVAKTDDDRLDFLGKSGFTQADARKVIAAVLKEEERPAESVWDFVQGITAVARDTPHQDSRVMLERAASKLLNKVRSA